ncbi:MAG: hypothetical protein ACI8W3_002989, partial [Myxococcota bacterium]
SEPAIASTVFVMTRDLSRIHQESDILFGSCRKEPI